ncbi:FAD-dependent oxidoreductase [Hydrogenophaga sp.]|uniref:FAD-dependent oxidoreductase n=1 Tax=Hydrogenophaga sp. TaxID=1904254 RepID=UPI0026153FB5|nr:FAD-dependent oxidoreductase [Hydrogenophaga sp.]MCW5652539.1 FAD-dependent oxidoreductase [Hydrogenophaga sp.]
MPSDRSPASSSPLHCDLLVIGSGAGGLSAAVTAARLGLSVVVAEKQARLGGTTAWSGGWMWIPRNPLAVEAGIQEPLEEPLGYLRHELGERFDEARARAYLENGPRMIEFFRTRTALRFIDGNAIPDFHGRSPHAREGGRSVCAAPFDGRRLGARMADLEPPLPETTLWGMGIASGAELRHYINALRSPASFAYVARRVLALARDRLLHGRSMRLVNGNALAGALLASAAEAGVDLRTRSPASRLLTREGAEGVGVSGAVLETPQGPLEVHARHGVLLACGGFPHDPERKKALLPHDPTGQCHWSAAARGNTGDGLRLGEAAGAPVSHDLVQAAALAPVSRVPRTDGSLCHFPHLIDRAKPGLIAVRSDGLRFVNEAESYHDFMQALLRATPAGETAQAWLVCDHAFIRRYGLGAAKPAPFSLRPWLRNGYLRRGRSLAQLAAACGIDAAALERTVARYNAQAQGGRDEDFAKGETPYNRMQGDAAYARERGWPNPCMAPLQRGPFYAVQVVPGSLGTFAGLRTDAHARVLDAQGVPIAGLYASGADQSSVMGGNYPSGGITLGPAMTFGFIAAHHAAGMSPSL